MAAARTAKRLARGGGDDVRRRKGTGRPRVRGHETGDVRHVGHEESAPVADLVPVVVVVTGVTALNAAVGSLGR